MLSRIWNQQTVGYAESSRSFLHNSRPTWMLYALLFSFKYVLEWRSGMENMKTNIFSNFSIWNIYCSFTNQNLKSWSFRSSLLDNADLRENAWRKHWWSSLSIKTSEVIYTILSRRFRETCFLMCDTIYGRRVHVPGVPKKLTIWEAHNFSFNLSIYYICSSFETKWNKFYSVWGVLEMGPI